MRLLKTGISVFSFLLLISITGLYSAQKQTSAKSGPLAVVGLYSETEDGHVSYRVGTGDWVVIKVGDSIPANAEIRVNVDRDWVELTPANNPTAVYEIDGSDKGDVIKKAGEISKEKPRFVSFPKVSDKTDPSFKNKLVVKQYLGRQIYADANGNEKDIKYGDRLDIKGKVTIIAINNTLLLAYPNGAVSNVIGPLKFDIEKLFTGQNIYKFLNVSK